MKLAAYLSRSRHGVFYFRWPIPNAPVSQQRLRISLQTRCPKRAGLLARHLASCGESLRLQLVGSTMRYDEIRTYVQGMLQDWLKRTIERLDREGPLHKYDPAADDGIVSLLRAGPDDYWEIFGTKEADRVLASLAAHSGQPRSEFDASKSDALEIFRKGYIAYWEAVAEHRQKLQSIDLLPNVGGNISLEERARVGAENPANTGATLEEAIKEYVRQHEARTWVERTRAKQVATLGILIELLGAATRMNTIGKAEAQIVKRTLIDLPTNWKKNPKTRNLPLAEAANVAGMAKLSTQTVNGHLGTFYTFFDWAVTHNFAKEKLFEGMKIRTKRLPSATSDARTAFSHDAISKMVSELTRPDSTLVKKDCYRWASLIGVFTGARLNEVCGLRASDVQEHNGVLCISINEDDPDQRKRLKTAAALRLVPVHSLLLKFGFEAFVAERREYGADTRLFPEFPFSLKHGFGRNQGRWFNETFLPALGLKTDQLVFHSLRHTMVTRLLQAGNTPALVQMLVGHERQGVTEKTYNREGYGVSQLKQVVETYHC